MGVHTTHLVSRFGRLWDKNLCCVENGLLSVIVNGKKRHRDDLYPLQFSNIAINADGSLVALSDKRGHITLLMLSTNRYREISCIGKRVSAMSFTNGLDESLMIARFRYIEVHSIGREKTISTLRKHVGPIHTLNTSSGRLALSASFDCAILWNVDDWTVYRRLCSKYSPIRAAALDGSGCRVATVHSDLRISIWGTNNKLGLVEEARLEDFLAESSSNASSSYFDTSQQSCRLDQPEVFINSFSIEEKYLAVAGHLNPHKNGFFVAVKMDPPNGGTLKGEGRNAMKKRNSQSHLRRVAYTKSEIISCQVCCKLWGGKKVTISLNLHEDGNLQLLRLKTFEILALIKEEPYVITKALMDPLGRFMFCAISNGSCQVRDVAASFEMKMKQKQREQFKQEASVSDVIIRLPKKPSEAYKPLRDPMATEIPSRLCSVSSSDISPIGVDLAQPSQRKISNLPSMNEESSPSKLPADFENIRKSSLGPRNSMSPIKDSSSTSSHHKKLIISNELANEIKQPEDISIQSFPCVDQQELCYEHYFPLSPNKLENFSLSISSKGKQACQIPSYLSSKYLDTPKNSEISCILRQNIDDSTSSKDAAQLPLGNLQVSQTLIDLPSAFIEGKKQFLEEKKAENLENLAIFNYRKNDSEVNLLDLAKSLGNNLDEIAASNLESFVENTPEKAIPSNPDGVGKKSGINSELNSISSIMLPMMESSNQERISKTFAALRCEEKADFCLKNTIDALEMLLKKPYNSLYDEGIARPEKYCDQVEDETRRKNDESLSSKSCDAHFSRNMLQNGGDNVVGLLIGENELNKFSVSLNETVRSRNSSKEEYFTPLSVSSNHWEGVCNLDETSKPHEQKNLIVSKASDKRGFPLHGILEKSSFEEKSPSSSVLPHSSLEDLQIEVSRTSSAPSKAEVDGYSCRLQRRDSSQNGDLKSFHDFKFRGGRIELEAGNRMNCEGDETSVLRPKNSFSNGSSSGTKLRGKTLGKKPIFLCENGGVLEGENLVVDGGKIQGAPMRNTVGKWFSKEVKSAGKDAISSSLPLFSLNTIKEEEEPIQSGNCSEIRCIPGNYLKLYGEDEKREGNPTNSTAYERKSIQNTHGIACNRILNTLKSVCVLPEAADKERQLKASTYHCQLQAIENAPNYPIKEDFPIETTPKTVSNPKKDQVEGLPIGCSSFQQDGGSDMTTNKSHTEKSSCRLPGRHESDDAYMRYFLDENLGFQEAHRASIYQQLLGLPKDERLFQSLLRKGWHPAYISLYRWEPFPNELMLVRLQVVLNVLLWWNPSIGGSLNKQSIPQALWPFINMFGGDLCFCFELFSSILTHWYTKLLALYGPSPSAIVSSMKASLEAVDTQLLSHLCKVTGNDLSIFLSPIYTLMSELLPKREFFLLWDYLISRHDMPSLLVSALLSFIVLSREKILHTVVDQSSLKKFFGRHHAVDMHRLLNMMLSISQNSIAASSNSTNAFLSRKLSYEKSDCGMKRIGKDSDEESLKINTASMNTPTASCSPVDFTFIKAENLMKEEEKKEEVVNEEITSKDEKKLDDAENDGTIEIQKRSENFTGIKLGVDFWEDFQRYDDALYLLRLQNAQKIRQFASRICYNSEDENPKKIENCQFLQQQQENLVDRLNHLNSSEKALKESHRIHQMKLLEDVSHLLSREANDRHEMLQKFQNAHQQLREQFSLFEKHILEEKKKQKEFELAVYENLRALEISHFPLGEAKSDELQIQASSPLHENSSDSKNFVAKENSNAAEKDLQANVVPEGLYSFTETSRNAFIKEAGNLAEEETDRLTEEADPELSNNFVGFSRLSQCAKKGIASPEDFDEDSLTLPVREFHKLSDGDGSRLDANLHHLNESVLSNSLGYGSAISQEDFVWYTPLHQSITLGMNIVDKY